MQFTKAESGIRKIFISQILFIIGFATSLITAVVSMLVHTMNGETQNQIVLTPFTSYLNYFSISIMMIGFIMMLIGVFIACVDDENFKVALYSIVFGVALAIISIVWSSVDAVGTITNLLTTLTSYLAILYIIQGIRNLAQKLERNDIEKKGSFLYKLFSVLYIFETCITISLLILSDISAIIPFFILQIVGDITSFFQNLLFMLYLGKAKRMLKKKRVKTNQEHI